MIEIIDILKPKNGGSFKLIDAIDVAIEGYTSLADCVSHMATTAMIEAINAALSGKQNKLSSAQLTAVNSGITSALVTQIGTNTTAIAGKASQSDLQALSGEVSTKADANDVATETAGLQAQIDAIVTPVTQDAEVQNARVDDNGVTHVSLKARCDSDTEMLTQKAEKAENQFLEVAVESENIFNIADVRKGMYISSNGTETADASSYITDYMPVDTGDLYQYGVIGTSIPNNYYMYFATYDSSKNFIERINAYYSSSYTPATGVAYIRICVYHNTFYQQFMMLKGNSLPTSFIPHFLISNNAIPEISEKVDTVIVNSPNIFNPATIVEGKYLHSNGTLVDDANSETSDLIAVTGGETYCFNWLPSDWFYYIGTFDSSGTYIERIGMRGEDPIITFGNTVASIRVSIYQHGFPDDYMFVKGSKLPKSFLPFGYIINPDLLSGNSMKNVQVRKVSSTQLEITTGKASHTLTLQTDVSKNLNTWRLTRGMVNSQQLWSEIDVEGPLKQKDVSDFMTGYHGDETYNTVTFVADGNEINLTDYENNDVINCDNFTVFVNSDVYLDGTETKAFERDKELIFGKGNMKVYNTYKYIGIESIDIDISTGTGLYAFSTNVVSGYTTNTKNKLIKETTTSINSRLDMVTFYGDEITINMKPIFGKEQGYYGAVYYYSEQSRYKAYFYQHFTRTGDYLTLNTNDELYSGYEIEFI